MVHYRYPKSVRSQPASHNLIGYGRQYICWSRVHVASLRQTLFSSSVSCIPIYRVFPTPSLSYTFPNLSFSLPSSFPSSTTPLSFYHHNTSSLSIPESPHLRFLNNFLFRISLLRLFLFLIISTASCLSCSSPCSSSHSCRDPN